MRGFFVIRRDVSNRQIAALVVIERIDLSFQGYSLAKGLANSPHAIKFRFERDATSMAWALVRFFSSVFKDITAISLNYSGVAPAMSKKSVNKTRWRLQR